MHSHSNPNDQQTSTSLVAHNIMLYALLRRDTSKKSPSQAGICVCDQVDVNMHPTNETETSSAVQQDMHVLHAVLLNNHTLHSSTAHTNNTAHLCLRFYTRT